LAKEIAIKEIRVRNKYKLRTFMNRPKIIADKGPYLCFREIGA
jgi:hypothetical protein